MPDPLVELAEILGAPMMTVGAEERARWHQHIIYAWLRGDDVLYIGCSWRGLERPMGCAHEKLRDFQPGDRLVIWPGPATAGGLWDAEAALIRRFRPLHNKPNGGALCPDCGGRWKLREHRAGRCLWCQRRRMHDAGLLSAD